MSDDLSEAFQMLCGDNMKTTTTTSSRRLATRLPTVDFRSKSSGSKLLAERRRAEIIETTAAAVGGGGGGGVWNRSGYSGEVKEAECLENDILVAQHCDEELNCYISVWRRSLQTQQDTSKFISIAAMKPYLLESFSYPKLPILQRRNEIVQLINQNPVVLISGSTGSGKSCLVPQFILEDCFATKRPCRIVITQPRRIAASSLCRYVCKMLRVPVGTLVGYKVANDKMSSPETAITFVTTGVLLQQLVAEKNLESYSHIIIDEVHERDQNIDFILLILRKLLRTVSPHTKIIMMSATLQKNIFSDYFTCLTSTNQLMPALCIEIISQPHDIQVFYEDDINTLNRKQCQIGDENLTCQNQVSLKNLSKILHILDLIESYESGRSNDFRFNASCKHALLIFLPGLSEIEDAYSVLMPHVSNNNLVLFRLHSQISNEDQQQIFRPMDPSFRKVILATNIAESSITIQDIVYVIDFCLTKQLCLNESTNYAQLQLQWASKASLEQRKGRSGRVQRGIVWRMCTESFYSQLPDYPVPEIQRCPLQQTILKAKLLDMGEPRSLLGNLLSPPSVNDIELSILRLKEIGALVGKQNKFDGELTFIGEIMAKLPVDPTLSKLCVLGFVFGLLDECCTLAAILSIKSFFSFRINDKLQSFKSKFIWSCRSKSDLISHLNAYNAWFKLSGGGVSSRKSRSWCKQELLNESIMSDVKLLKDNLMNSLSKIGMNSNSIVERTHPCLVDPKQKTELLKFVIAGAFYPHYFQMAPVDRKLAEKTSNGRSPKSTIFLHGLPMNRGKHFEESLLNYARQFGNVKCIDFDCTKCFIEFSHESTPDFRIPNSVYFALKDRYIRSRNSVNGKLSRSLMANRNTVGFNSKTNEELNINETPNSFLPLRNNSMQNSDSYKPLANHVDLPKSSIKRIDIIITEVVSPVLFWAQYESENFQQAILFIQETLNKFGGSDHRRLLKVPKPGDKILCRNNSLNNELCRAVVINCSPTDANDDNSEGICDVFCVDYGQRRSIHFSELMHAPQGMFEIKYQCFQVQLAQLEINQKILRSTSEFNKAKEFVWQRVKDSIQYAQIEAIRDGKIYADICIDDSNGSRLENLAKILIDSEICSEVRPDVGLSNIVGDTQFWKTNSGNYDSGNANNIFPLGAQVNDVFDSSELDEEGLGGFQSEVALDGPFSALESKFMPIFGGRCSTSSTSSISPFSVNSVVLEDTFEHEQAIPIMIASSLKSVGSKISCDFTTILTDYDNILAKLLIIFAPKCHLMDYDEEKCEYHGLLCGIGSQLSSSDLNIKFEYPLSLDPVETAAEMRECMNRILKSSEDAKLGTRIVFHSQPMILEVQDRLLNLYLKLTGDDSRRLDNASSAGAERDKIDHRGNKHHFDDIKTIKYYYGSYEWN